MKSIFINIKIVHLIDDMIDDYFEKAEYKLPNAQTRASFWRDLLKSQYKKHGLNKYNSSKFIRPPDREIFHFQYQFETIAIEFNFDVSAFLSRISKIPDYHSKYAEEIKLDLIQHYEHGTQIMYNSDETSIKNDLKTSPILIAPFYFVENSTGLVIDGNHRVKAHKEQKRNSIEAYLISAKTAYLAIMGEFERDLYYLSVEINTLSQ